MKGASEGLVRVVTGLEGKVGHGVILELETVCGAFETQAADMLLNRFANQAAEDAVKVVRRETGDAGQIVQIEGVVKVSLDMDQGAQDALVVVGCGGGSHTVWGCRPASQAAPARNAG